MPSDRDVALVRAGLEAASKHMLHLAKDAATKGYAELDGPFHELAAEIRALDPAAIAATVPEASAESNELAALRRTVDEGCCTLAGPGRGDCEHFVGLPGLSVPGQHDGPDDTVDAYGKPNGWCWLCWLSYRLAALRRDADTMRGLLRTWLSTEMDAQDEEFEPWLDDFTARVRAVVDALYTPPSCQDHAGEAGTPPPLP